MHILFDIGKTKMRLARYEGGSSFGDVEIVETPNAFDDLIERFVQTAEKLAGGEKILSSMGGIGAPLNREKTKTVGMKWIGEPLRDRLSEKLNAPVYLENDANLAGIGESVFGAGRGYEIVAYITVSTGVGGTRIVNDAVDEVALGFEPGHQVIDIDRSACPHCPSNTLQGYISGAAIKERFGKQPKEIVDGLLWNKELPRFLAYGLNNITVHWSPDVIVLGGSMITGDPAISISATKDYLKDILKIFPAIPDIRKSELGDFSVLHGAMAYTQYIKKSGA